MTGFVQQTLGQLVSVLAVQVDTTIPSVPITGVVFDSRLVQPGNIFVALTGGSTDGHRFIPQVIERGAAAIVGSQPMGSLPVPYIQVENSRKALGLLSAAFYRFPARHLTMVGVTGTDGKTTTSSLLYQILLSAGLRSGIISTVNATIGTEVLDTGFHVTTPEAPDIQRYLARMLAAGMTHVVLETTSHGLAQDRVLGCEFDVGVVTNITHEHLDYHGTYDNYRAAKARLFSSLTATLPKPMGNPRVAVLNRDDASYDYLAQFTEVKQVTYSLNPGADVWADEVSFRPDGLHFVAHGPGFSIPIDTGLVGAFNVSNCLAAIAASVVGLNLPPQDALLGIAAFKGVPGRMEAIHLGQEFTAIVDFAHTPNALKRALETVRGITGGRVIALFGSAGLRDREKRRMMAEISAEYADLTVLTAEDPRSESLADILDEMAQGAVSKGGEEGQTFWRVPDRGEAIRFAVRQARPGDLVIACGKGHEQSMCFGNQEYLWDDRTAMQAALADLLGIPGPEMPYLPRTGDSG